MVYKGRYINTLPFLSFTAVIVGIQSVAVDVNASHLRRSRSFEHACSYMHSFVNIAELQNSLLSSTFKTPNSRLIQGRTDSIND